MNLIESFPWWGYSRKLDQKIRFPSHRGTFGQEAVVGKNLRLVTGEAGEIDEGNFVRLYLLVDRDDGMIVDGKFLAYGQTALIGAADALLDLVPGKNYDQAKRISADLIDKELRDRADTPAFPKETYPHLNLVLFALDEAAEECSDLPLPLHYMAPPAPREIGEVLEGGYPGWDGLAMKEKVAIINDVLDREVRPYIALDGGGVELVELVKNEMIIDYQGNCTSCFSAVGATLSYIQQVIRAKVHPDLNVIPRGL